MTTVEKSLEKWLTKDPYLTDVDGFRKSIAQKGDQVQVQASVSVNVGYSGGYQVVLEVPYAEIPEGYKELPDPEVQRRINRMTKDLRATLREIGYENKVWSSLFNEDEEEPHIEKDKLTHGSTTVFRHYPVQISQPHEAEIEDRKDLEKYVRNRMQSTPLFSLEEKSTSEMTYSSGKHEKRSVPTLAMQIVKTAWTQPNKKEAADSLIDREEGIRLSQLEEGKWYYFGDEQHRKEKRIRHNAEVMLKLWKTVGKHLPNCWLIHKDYDMRTIYFGLRQGARKVRLPPFSIYGWDIKRVLFAIFSYDREIHELETDEPVGDQWEVIEQLALMLLEEGIPNYDDPFEDDYVWVLEKGRPLPVISAGSQTIGEVVEFLAKGEIEWDPAYDEVVRGSGGIEVVHPFLRRPLTLVWQPEEAVWEPPADTCREIWYRKYDYEELTPLTVKDLRAICVAKGLNPQGRKYELIEKIHKACWPAGEKVDRQESRGVLS